MSYQLTHERCSELLFAYAREELDDVDASQVASHLDTCAECRSELAGLKALLAPEVEGLTEAERIRLHRGIQATLVSPEKTPAPVGSIDARRKQRWGQRAAQALGVAAALAVIAVGIGSLTSGGPQDDQAGAGGGDDAAVEGGGGAELPGPRPRFALAAPVPDALAEEGSGARSSAKNSELALFAVRNLDLSRRSYLADLGRNRLLSRFANSYSAAVAEELGPAFVDALASGARSESNEVASCAQTVTEAAPGPIVPVFGSFTRFQGNDALVIAFIYTDEESGRLDRYTIWVWRRGACDAPLTSASGTVR